MPSKASLERTRKSCRQSLGGSSRIASALQLEEKFSLLTGIDAGDHFTKIPQTRTLAASPANERALSPRKIAH